MTCVLAFLALVLTQSDVHRAEPLRNMPTCVVNIPDTWISVGANRGNVKALIYGSLKNAGIPYYQSGEEAFAAEYKLHPEATPNPPILLVSPEVITKTFGSSKVACVSVHVRVGTIEAPQWGGEKGVMSVYDWNIWDLGTDATKNDRLEIVLTKVMDDFCHDFVSVNAGK